MREQWAEAFSETARQHWTEARTRELIADRRPLILPGEAPVLLRALGLLHRDGSMPKKESRKYRQINHMVEVLDHSLFQLRQRLPTIHILDAGCGRSYLTILLAWCFKHVFKHPVRILGVDREAKLIEECRRRAALVELEDVMRFEAATLTELRTRGPRAIFADAFGLDPGATDVHAFIALHACDTATDEAIVAGLAAGADVIAVAPCCQAELGHQWRANANADREGAFAPLWSTPHLRSKLAATMTDTFRTLLLQSAGYTTMTMEFVDTRHTPKNTLIRAMRPVDAAPDALEATSARAWADYTALRDTTGSGDITLARLLAQLNPPRED